jgi:hypothetical protein
MARDMARQIVRILVRSFERREGVFSDTKELLENQIPRGVKPESREHANFLFYLISQDHGVKSAKLYERAKTLYSSNPNIFDPNWISQHHHSEDDPSLIGILKALSVRYPNNGAKSWYRNSSRLCALYTADARNIFACESANEIVKRIRAFHGFGPKTGGLLFRVFVGIGISNPTDLCDVNFPTDIHDTRIASLTKIADIPSTISEENYAPYVRIVERVWKQACQEESVNWLQVDRALWILGSKGCVTERHYDCPLRESCIKGRASLV